MRPDCQIESIEQILEPIAAILAADVFGYTRLMGDDEAGTLRRLTELREQALEPLITEHRGRVVKLMGDGLLVEFASVVDAVACAVAWQNDVGEGDHKKPLGYPGNLTVLKCFP